MFPLYTEQAKNDGSVKDGKTGIGIVKNIYALD